MGGMEGRGEGGRKGGGRKEDVYKRPWNETLRRMTPLMGGMKMRE